MSGVIQPGNVVTSYAYDDLGNLAEVTDGKNQTTFYIYDDMGRLIETNSPDTGTTNYSYDEAGNLTAKTDAKGQTITYGYDALNRLTNVIFEDASEDIVFTYDAGTNGKGRLTGRTDPSGAYGYTYDTLGRLTSEQKTIVSVTYTTQYNYDAAGNLTGVTHPDGRIVSYELDGAGRVNRVTTIKDSITVTLAENIAYLPFGPMNTLWDVGTLVRKYIVNPMGIN